MTHSKFDIVVVAGQQVEIETKPSGYRCASVIGYGADLVVRPDGSHSWSNVKDDSPLYALMNSALAAHADK